jgi:hypothetical protein
MVRFVAVVSVLASAVFVLADDPYADAVPINQFPFLMTHDSATGYLEGGSPTYWWAKTQTVGFGGQVRETISLQAPANHVHHYPPLPSPLPRAPGRPRAERARSTCGRWCRTTATS